MYCSLMLITWYVRFTMPNMSQYVSITLTTTTALLHYDASSGQVAPQLVVMRWGHLSCSSVGVRLFGQCNTERHHPAKQHGQCLEDMVLINATSVSLQFVWTIFSFFKKSFMFVSSFQELLSELAHHPWWIRWFSAAVRDNQDVVRKP